MAKRKKSSNAAKNVATTKKVEKVEEKEKVEMVMVVDKEEKKAIILTREMLLETRDTLKLEPVVLTRGTVYVREMTGKEKDIWERSMMKRVSVPGGAQVAGQQTQYETTLENYKGKLAVSTLSDENGNLLFDMRDVAKLSSMMSASNLEKVVEAAQKINAISEADKKDILGNSEAGQQNNSTLGSAGN